MSIGKPKPRTASPAKPTGRPAKSNRAAKPSVPASAAPHKPGLVTPTTKPPGAQPSMDFPGRTTLKPHECARSIGCHTDHILDLVEEGILKAVDIAGGGNLTDRRFLRIPVEAWRKFIADRSTS